MPTYTPQQIASQKALKEKIAGSAGVTTRPTTQNNVAPKPAFNPNQDLMRDEAKYNASMQKPTLTDDGKVPGAPQMPAPKTPTVSDIYGGLVSPQETAMNDAYKQQEAYYKESMAPVDEAAIRQKTMDQFQAEIDAVNKIYAQKKQEEAVAGQGRLGSSAAIQARSGLLGSDFGAAQTEKTSQYNRDLQASIDAEKALKIQNIFNNARTEAQKEIDAKRQARKEGYSSYMDYLKGANDRNTQKVTQYADQLLYSGVEIKDADINALAEQLGVSPQALKAQYNKAKEVRDASKKAQEPITEKIGNTLLVYNPTTGRYEQQYSAPEEARKPITQTVGGNMLQYNPSTGQWENIFTAPESASDLKKVTINGVDYMQDANGNLITPKVPTVPTAERISQAQKIKDTAQSILDSEDWTNAVGPTSSQIPQWMRTGKRNAVDAKIKLLQGLLTLPNLGILKGPMSDKDIEFLRNASTAGLATNIDEAEFERIMKGIIADSDKVINNAVTSTPQVTEQQRAEIDSMRKQLENEGFSPQEIEDAIRAEYPSFNTESQTSLNGSISSPLAMSIVQQESGGNYNSVGDVPAGYSEEDRALGKYQIVPKYHFQKIGLTNTPENRKKFLNSPELQDQLFSKIISGLESQYGGNPTKVAAAYYGGPKAASIVGTPEGDKPQYAGGKKYPSINQYARSVVSRIS